MSQICSTHERGEKCLIFARLTQKTITKTNIQGIMDIELILESWNELVRR
jgi:hypothetical protein